ncbi:MAG: hypothetical protein ABIB11_00050 [Candidatus Omnitrophota bacterium]
MRKLYPFGWIDRDLKELGFLKEMSASATKLYILYVLSGGADSKSFYSAKKIQEVTGLANATIYRARKELEAIGLITTRKEMVKGKRNKKPRVIVELQDLPVNKFEFKQRRDLAHNNVNKCRRGLRPRTNNTPYKSNWPDWMKQGAEKLRRKYQNA